jgi:hypothetical protein
MSFFKDHPYVDGYYEHPQTGRRMAWKRMLKSEVPAKIIQPALGRNCFYSIQRFADAVPLRDQIKDAAAKGKKVDPDLVPAQVHYAPLFFDFDAKPSDYDGKIELSLAAAQKDVIKIINFMFGLGIMAPQVLTWFSGQKGFHVLVHPDVFAIKPHPDLTRIIKRAAAYLKEHLGLSTLDMSVYSVPRVWRIPNTLHQKTNLHKREIASNRFFETSVEKILELAREPGPNDGIWDTAEHQNVSPEPDAVTFFSRFIEQWQAEKEMHQNRPRLKVLKDPQGFPACVKDILENGLKEKGANRNKATVALAAYFKDVDMPIEDAHALLCEWNATLPGNNTRVLVDRNANALSVLRSAYAGAIYRHSCRCMWALSGPADKVACVGVAHCPTVNGKTPEEKVASQEPEEIPTVALNQVRSSRFNGQSVQFAFHVSGKLSSVYVVPKNVTAICTPKPNTDLCQSCRNIKFAEGDLGEKNEGDIQARQNLEFTHLHRDLIAMTQCSDEQKKGKIKAALGIPGRCLRQAIMTEKTADLEELRLIPLVDDVGIYEAPTDPEGPEDVAMASLGQEHVVVKAFHLVDENKGPIKANQKYKAWGIPYGSPRDQSATVLIYDHLPAQDDIENFRLDKELREKLKIFQVGRSQTVAQKWDEIHEDLEINVHHIWGRRDMAMAIDLSYHSILHFRFMGLLVQKGWVELLIIGDSASGKTEIAKSFLRHYRLGEMTGAEGAKRTGLVYAQIAAGKDGGFILEWGKIPRNDGRLLFIDEFAGLSQEAIGEMTRLRSEGIAESQGSGQQITWARTRLILMTNPRNNKPMNSFDYGCVAVEQLFNSQADMRRVDLAVGVRNGDIPLKIINQRAGERQCEHRYNSDLCRKLVLWAWSRRERDVIIDDVATDYIREEAGRLGEKYGSADVSLVTGADQRIKLARMSVACAARLYSTDDEGRKVIVKKEHVKFVVDLLERSYDDKHGLELNLFSLRAAKRTTLSADEERRLRGEFRQFANWAGIREALFDTSYFRERDIASQIGYEKNEMQALMKWLHKSRLIQSTPAGFRKTPMFIDLLKRIDITKDEIPTNSHDPDDIGEEPPY